MATQMYELDWNDVPNLAPVANKQQIIDYCRHFGQDTIELKEFLSRFDFDEWRTMSIGIDGVYARHSDKKSEVGNDAVSILGIIATTFLDDESELALQNYLGWDKKSFEADDVTFTVFPDCPLWVVQVQEQSRFYMQAIVFMPAVFFNVAAFTSESYGYPKYSITPYQWYREDFSKSTYRNDYWRNRIGSYSPNFISKVKTDFKPEVVTVSDTIYNEFSNEFWDVVIDKKGVLVKRAGDAEARRFKFGELKIQSSSYSNRPDSLKIAVNHNNTVIFSGDGVVLLLKPDFTFVRLNIKKEISKQLPVFFYTTTFFSTYEHLVISPDRQWFRAGNVFFEMGTDEKPVELINKLYAITGETIFYCAVHDIELKGIWLMAGNNRLVFVDEALQKGYVFNFEEQDTLYIESTYEFMGETRIRRTWLPDHHTQLFFDDAQNLMHSINRKDFFKIDREHLKEKLKSAVPFTAEK